MLQATLGLARRVERFEIEFCALGAGAARHACVETLAVGGGLAVCGAPGLPMNKVVGLGLGSDVSDDLDLLEDFYSERKVAAQIELCPLAVPGLAARLNRRGYVLQGFENELARELGGAPLPRAGECLVTDVGPEAVDLWISVVSEGFATSETSSVPPAPGVIDAFGDVMRSFCHPDIARFIGWLDESPAGAGSSYTKDGVVGIFGTATVPRFRRRGLHHALVAHSIDVALGRADLAVATTEPGSMSQRTFERLGFQVLYTRAIMVKP